MKPKALNTFIIVAFITCFCNCSKTSEPEALEVIMAPLEVGTKTPDYEVISPTELRLSPGVTIKVLTGPKGEKNGFVVLRPNGEIGGFMSCECVGATINACKEGSDNPQFAFCTGGCLDSEGNSHGCQLVGPIIGPPKDPYVIRVLSR